MKLFLLMTCLLVSFSSLGITHGKIEALLKSKNISLQKMEQQGAKVLMGEVTGHKNAVPFAKIQVLITEKKAILKNEIDSVDFQGAKQFGNIVVVRSQGLYVLKQDVKAIIVLGQ
jgi:hypothetical protein